MLINTFLTHYTYYMLCGNQRTCPAGYWHQQLTECVRTAAKPEQIISIFASEARRALFERQWGTSTGICEKMQRNNSQLKTLGRVTQRENSR